jgi:hypothetical protein
MKKFYNKIYVVILEFDIQTVLSYLTITYFTIKKILEVNKKQNKNLKQIRIIYNLTGKL